MYSRKLYKLYIVYPNTHTLEVPRDICPLAIYIVYPNNMFADALFAFNAKRAPAKFAGKEVDCEYRVCVRDHQQAPTVLCIP